MRMTWTDQIFEDIIETMREAVLVLDSGLNILFANRSFYDLFKVTPEETSGSLIYDLGNRQWNIPKLRDLLEEILPKDNKFNNYEVEHEFMDIGHKVMLLNARRLIEEESDSHKILLAIEDITDRKRLESILKDSEERFRRLFETANDGILLLEKSELKIRHGNPAITRLLGYSSGDLVGSDLKNVGFPEDIDTPQEILQTLNKDGIYFYSDALLKNKDGQDVDADIYMVNKASLVQCNIRDITEKKLADKKLKRIHAQLQQSQKMETVGTLAGGIAHDFNNLLMAIQGRTSIMLMDKDSSHPDFGHLRGIEGSIGSAADLTKQLLGFARGGKYEVKPTDLNELIRKESRMFGRTKKEITILEKFEDNLWTVEVDRGQIEQVLLNLYVNAWQAMPGVGDLYLETENMILDESYVKPFSIEPGRYVKISVTDTGIGMDKATQKKIFDPFFTTKEMGRGTGLGLATAYGIIKNHGGFINVYSEKGHGSIFSVYLPASEKEVIEERKSAGVTLRGSETILFVDDEEMITEVGEDLLELLGYKALIARSGKEAIRIYEENKDRIDIVVLDMIMPDMAGGETYDRLKDINPKVKVLLSSGYSINGQATEILDRGCNGFIQKPFKMKELSQKLREILDEK